MPVIKNNIQRPPSAIGVDIMQEERQVFSQKIIFGRISMNRFLCKLMYTV